MYDGTTTNLLCPPRSAAAGGSDGYYNQVHGWDRKRGESNRYWTSDNSSLCEMHWILVLCLIMCFSCVSMTTVSAQSTAQLLAFLPAQHGPLWALRPKELPPSPLNNTPIWTAAGETWRTQLLRASPSYWQKKGKITGFMSVAPTTRYIAYELTNER